MSSYIHLKNILSDFVDKDLSENGGVCENIILWHTLNTDKNIVVDLIKENYGKIPEIKNAIKQLKGSVSTTSEGFRVNFCVKFIP